jgi:hypothetical protein
VIIEGTRLYCHRIFHELIWTVLQGAGREAVVNLLQAACNTAEPFKVTRPKGEFPNIIMLKFHKTANYSLHTEKQPGFKLNILLFIVISSFVGKYHEIFGLNVSVINVWPESFYFPATIKSELPKGILNP